MATEQQQITALKKEIQSLKKTVKEHEVQIQSFKGFCKNTTDFATSTKIINEIHERLISILEKRMEVTEKRLVSKFLIECQIMATKEKDVASDNSGQGKQDHAPQHSSYQ